MLHRNMKKAEARKEAIRMLKMVNIPSAEKTGGRIIPHETVRLGMRQESYDRYGACLQPEDSHCR
mgnify:CR=1 FL=1